MKEIFLSTAEFCIAAVGAVAWSPRRTVPFGVLASRLETLRLGRRLS
ncbi:MAG TPA: hypothetical protein VGB69_11865 [Edaphobacter sp.]